MENKRLKKLVMEVVESQISQNDPPCTARAYRILQDMGLTETEAKERIGAVLLEDMFYILKGERKFNEQEFEKRLNSLIHELDEYEMYDSIEEPAGDWEEISRLIDQGYGFMESNGESHEEVISVWMQAWELLKEKVLESKEKNQGLVPEIYEIDEATDYEYDIEGWLDDLTDELLYSGKYEERIAFSKEVIELFPWESASPVSFKQAIGEAMSASGKVQESDEWFEDWLVEEPENMLAVTSYLLCLEEREDYESSERLLAKYLNKNTVCNEENEMLFFHAGKIYERLGEYEKAERYLEKLRSHIEEVNEMMESVDWDEDDFFMQPQQPIVKEKKIYPNDPCPCGSGKKYKKCCGKK